MAQEATESRFSDHCGAPYDGGEGESGDDSVLLNAIAFFNHGTNIILYHTMFYCTILYYTILYYTHMITYNVKQYTTT